MLDVYTKTSNQRGTLGEHTGDNVQHMTCSTSINSPGQPLKQTPLLNLVVGTRKLLYLLICTGLALAGILRCLQDLL